MSSKVSRLFLGSCAFLLTILGPPIPVALADDMSLSKISEGGRFTKQDGFEIYRAVCQACHLSNGQGAIGAGAYPPLAGNPKIAAATYVAYNVLNGRRGMPGFGYFLDDKQVAAVTMYVRTNLGNNYPDAISVTDVAKLRMPSKGVFEE